MTDNMPTNIWAGRDNKGTYWLDHAYGVSEYTLVHNNPDYHVIKKSDVNGDVNCDAINDALGALQDIKQSLMLSHIYDDDEGKWLKTIRNALIAQSDPDIVRIPRKVLEGMKVWIEQYDTWTPSIAHDEGYNQAINNVLNYKEGE